MKTIAEALINLVAFVEFSDDDVIDPDSAVKALEMTSAVLADCTEEELDALRVVLQEEREGHAKLGASPEVLAFFDNFFEDFGLGEEAEWEE